MMGVGNPVHMIVSTFGLAMVAALLTLVSAAVLHPVIAIAVPVALTVGLAIAVRPEVGALFLIFFSYLDGISDMIFAPSPIGGFKLMTAATVFGLLVTAHQHRSYLRQVFREPVTLYLMGFAGAWAIAILFAESKAAAMSWGIRLSTIKMLFILILMSLRTQKTVTLGIYCLALTSAISAVILIIDTMLGVTLVSTSEAATTARSSEGFDRSSGGSQYNPTTAATMLLCGTILALVHCIESPHYRRLMGAAAFLGTAAVVLSFARSAALVYAVIVIILCFRYGRYKLFAPAAVLGSIGAFAMLPFVPPEYFERITSIFGSGDWTLGRRMTYNVIGIDLLIKHPVFGVGPGNFFGLFTDSDYRYLPGRTLTGRQLHNMYLSVAVEYGLFGFTFFMGMIVTAFKLVKSVEATPANDRFRAIAVSLFYAMLAFYIVSVFVPNEYNKYTWILPALATALSLQNRKMLREGPLT